MEPGDTLQSATGGPEYLPGHCHLSKLKHQPPRHLIANVVAGVDPC